MTPTARKLACTNAVSAQGAGADPPTAGAWRPGDMVGIRVILKLEPTSQLGEGIGAWVQWEVPNADGDIAEYGRQVTLTKGREDRVLGGPGSKHGACCNRAWPSSGP